MMARGNRERFGRCVACAAVPVLLLLLSAMASPAPAAEAVLPKARPAVRDGSAAAIAAPLSAPVPRPREEVVRQSGDVPAEPDGVASMNRAGPPAGVRPARAIPAPAPRPEAAPVEGRHRIRPSDRQPEERFVPEPRVTPNDPEAEAPTVTNARWVGFAPAVYSGSDTRPGAWIAGPFDRKERTGWIADTATGATARVTFLWRDAGRGSRTATLSMEAARALGLGQGDVASIAVYLPR